MNRSQLDHILKAHHRDAYLWARQCCSFEDEMAKDVLQQSYLKILEGQAKLKDASKAKTWLFSIIRYTAIDELRKAGKVVSLMDSYDPIEIIEEVDGTNYEEIIKLLPEMQREVILMVFYHQMTIAQSAEILQIGLGTARTHYDRGKKKLKELITKVQIQEEYGK
ncbi:RNA polymerase sigma factor [Algoriphagus aquimarinus]|uniref:RNA polymerase sigma-70 factor, ECF subfamily n=1 Tax=Algoriphagus aquimarinus TaxID=237018 RepID=A0A1I1BKQ4_9BACT|nr:RNA polymerase sigma factor [Algoriphagus aquimarinus]SFB49060.1 RNA polymerase sigma-70 factor, ECF subfamily [Algoriphagus aquimarinus]|tara:strand:+ start:169521 stop:170015 length:495 start_codon:yes stop_codon:yes gene_type:complete